MHFDNVELTLAVCLTNYFLRNIYPAPWIGFKIQIQKIIVHLKHHIKQTEIS